MDQPSERAGERLEAARKAAECSLGDAAFLLRDTLGKRRAISGQAIRNYELEEVPEKRWDVLVVKALCDAYRVRIEEVSEIAARAWEEEQPRLRALVTPRDAGSEGDSGGPATSAHETMPQSAQNPRDVEFWAQAA